MVSTSITCYMYRITQSVEVSNKILQSPKIHTNETRAISSNLTRGTMSDRFRITPNLNKPLINAVSMATSITGPASNINGIPGFHMTSFGRTLRLEPLAFKFQILIVKILKETLSLQGTGTHYLLVYLKALIQFLQVALVMAF